MHIVPLVLMGMVASGASAHADPESFNPQAFNLSGALDREVAPTRRSLEIALGGGYTQGVGGAGAVGSVEDVTGPGGTVEVQLGLRVSPRFSIGAYGTFARFQHGDAVMDGSRADAATAGLQVVWHSRQTRSLAPWIGLGAGWRGLWLTPNGGAAPTSVHGIEVLRLQLGVDYRITPGIAITPVLGVSTSLFLVEDAAMPSNFTAVHDNRLNLYGFTGILGRFNLGG
jgi:hypothetical protein